VLPPRRDANEVIAAAVAGHRMAGLVPDAAARATARRIVDGDLTADEAVQRLRDDLPAGG
jgi:hypothetical protein